VKSNSSRSISELAAGAVLALGLNAAAFAAQPTVQSQGPAHTVPTNVPGIYAYTQPPASFDPHRATDQELVAWGYPARPAAAADAAAWARWEQLVNPAVQRLIPELRQRPGVYHRPVRGLRRDTLQSNVNAPDASTSSNWSGFALVPNSGQQPYAQVEAAWTVPTVKQAPHTCSGGWDYSSQWVGLGGFADSYLLQAGSAANVFCDIGNNVAEYFPWIEWLPAAETVLYANAATSQLFPFAPGDYLIVTVTATNFSGGVSTSGTLLFQDVTQAWSVSLSFTASSLGGSEVTGQSAEWIVERTEVDGSFATLPDYVANPWWFTRTKDLGAVLHYPGEPGAATSNQITMVDNSSADVSFVNLVGVDALWFFPEGSATQ
jgi:hypothetical protein